MTPLRSFEWNSNIKLQFEFELEIEGKKISRGSYQIL